MRAMIIILLIIVFVLLTYSPDRTAEEEKEFILATMYKTPLPDKLYGGKGAQHVVQLTKKKGKFYFGDEGSYELPVVKVKDMESDKPQLIFLLLGNDGRKKVILEYPIPEITMLCFGEHGYNNYNGQYFIFSKDKGGRFEKLDSGKLNVPESFADILCEHNFYFYSRIRKPSYIFEGLLWVSKIQLS